MKAFCGAFQLCFRVRRADGHEIRANVRDESHFLEYIFIPSLSFLLFFFTIPCSTSFSLFMRMFKA